MRPIMSLLALSLTLTGCFDNDSKPATSPRYHATIIYTEHGVPHIQAADYPSLGYGVGYAQAQDNLCTLAEQLMKMKGEKARFLGPGTGNRNLLSDVGYRALDLPAQAQGHYGKLSAEAQGLMQGYADGFNKALAEKGGNYPTPCLGADWVRPITAQELLAYHLDLALLSSGRNFLAAHAAAQPPVAVASAKSSRASSRLVAQLDAEALLTPRGIGSNGWALGQDRAQGAKSLLLGNPHFPWDGELRFFEQQLTIPGQLNVTGGSFVGLPAVLIGFNEHLGWTHTVSQSKRSTLYQLELDPSNPLRYKVDGEYRDMTAKTVTLPVKQADGSLVNYSQKVYFSHFGPIVNLASLNSALGWSTTSAISYRDANAGNYKMLDQWLAMGRAQNKDEFKAAFAEHQGTPWVNTLMIDKAGGAHYIDGTHVPNLSAYAEGWLRQAIATPLMAALWQDGEGSVLLPGNDSRFEWVNDPNTRFPGLVPFSRAPQQSRTDYTFNANSSHWLGNVSAPLEGYSILYGPEKTVRSPRTRYNAQLISDMSGQGLAGSDNRFSLGELKNVLSHNGSLFAGSFRQQVVERCQAQPGISLDGAAVDLSPACTVLAQWDGRYNLNSRGAHLMRELMSEFRVGGHGELNPQLFALAFDPAQAASTPRDLRPLDLADVNNDLVLKGLARAMQRLNKVGIALDAELGTIQYVLKSAQHKLPVSGGNSFEGLFNMSQTNVPTRSTSDLANVITGSLIAGSRLTSLDENGDGKAEAAYRLNYGSSFVLALAFDAQGPRADMLQAYGQSHDPKSPEFADQTEKFSRLEWRPMRFSAEDVKQHAQRTLTLSAPR